MTGVRRLADRSQADIMAERKRRRTEIIERLRRSERMSNEISVKITLLPGAELPKYARPGDSGFDLVAQEDYVVEPGQTAKIRTGICVELPPGTELQVRPRSGISERTKLRVANSPGTGDSSYRGEICVLIDNIAPVFMQNEHVTDCYEDITGTLREAVSGRYALNTYIIRRGERIAQAVIAPVCRAAFEVVSELTETERGAGGFGSSGTASEVSV